MQRHNPLEIVREMRAPFRLALGKGLFLTVIGMRHVIDTGEQPAEEFAVIHNAAHRNAAKAHAVIAALTPDQPGFLALTANVPIGKRDFQRRINGLGA